MEKQTIKLDFAGVRYLGQVHGILKQAFQLPDYYGENWSALWDCLDHLFYGQGDVDVEVMNFHSLPENLREYCATMLEIFQKVHEGTPNVNFIVEET